MDWPTVDVVIPTLNSESTLSICLESIRRQKYLGVINTIIIDGGSNDKTIQIAKEFGCDVYVFSKVYSNGTSGARNLSLKLLKGDLYWQIDSDNIVLGTDCLSLLVRPFMDDDSLNLSVPYITWLDEQQPLDKFISFCELQKIKRMEQVGRGELNYTVIGNMTYGITNASLIRRETLVKVGGYDSDIRVLRRMQSQGLSRGAIVSQAKYIHFQGENLKKWYQKQLRRIKYFGKFQKRDLNSYFVDRTYDFRAEQIEGSINLVVYSIMLFREDSPFWYYGFLMLLIYFLILVTHPILFFQTFLKFLGKK
jgi:glycosyltransferase involved in cell wall biosynthesis